MLILSGADKQKYSANALLYLQKYSTIFHKRQVYAANH